MGYFDEDPYADLEVTDITLIEDDYFYEDMVEEFSVEHRASLEYPCFIIDGSISYPNHKIQVVQHMVASDNHSADIHLYIENDGEYFSIGTVSTSQVKSVLNLLDTDTNQLVGYLDESTKLVGHMRLVLAT